MAVITIADRRSVLATVTCENARRLLFIPSYNEVDPASSAADKHGYQRPPAGQRIRPIAKYVMTEENAARVPPLFVSARVSHDDAVDYVAMLHDGNIDGIIARFGEKSTAVVDGQHRLLGLLHAAEEDKKFAPRIPLMVNFGLSFAEEAELFNTLNSTQQKLPKALIEVNKGDITESGAISHSQAIRRLTFALCRDTDSPWGPDEKGVETINMTGARDTERPVTYEGLRRSTSNMFPADFHRRLERMEPNLPLTFAKRYWKAVANACPAAWQGIPATRTQVDESGDEHTVKIHYRLKDLVGVASLAKLGKDILEAQVISREEDTLEALVGRLSEVDWEKDKDNPWMRSQAGFAGQKDMYSMLYDLVFSNIRPDEQP